MSDFERIELLRIAGRVQGVGFRWSMLTEAHRLGVAGWVRNRLDGSVEALVAGTAEQVEAMLAWAQHGPPMARVREVTQTALPAGEAIPQPFSERETV
jgi:acylphosphatase